MNPVPLGLGKDNKDGENIVKNGIDLKYSADIFAIFEDVPLIIDCTVAGAR